MTLIVRVARRAWSLLALSLAVGACDGVDPTAPADNRDPATAPGPGPAPTFSSAFLGGIPIGLWAQPTIAFSDWLNGAVRNIPPKDLLSELAGIKARGGKVVLTLSGSPNNYLSEDGHFDLGKWKARIDRYQGVNFSSYIKDGTIVGHILVDEPNDPSNWNGVKITPAGVEDMARYSKQFWPGMPTIVRAEPAYFNPLAGQLRYLDAAWAQYVYRKGTAQDYLARNVADAQRNGMALVVGLNVSAGNADKAEMSAGEIQSWGSTMLSSNYPCAFISWKYHSDQVDRPAVREAMVALAEKAQNRASKSCHGANTETPVAEPAPAEQPPPPATVIQLTTAGVVERNDRYYLVLKWSGAAGSMVDLYRDGVLRKWSPPNTGTARVLIDPRSSKPAVFKVCEQGTSRCSNTVTVSLGS